MLSQDVVLSWYTHEKPSIRMNIARVLGAGQLGGTGKLVIFPVDQGVEHGPDRSFGMNSGNNNDTNNINCDSGAMYRHGAYDPLYHASMAIDGKVSAFVALPGMIEVIASSNLLYKMPPMIMKLNCANSLTNDDADPYQAIIATPAHALDMGCVGVGLTIYPGSSNFGSSIEHVCRIINEAKSLGLFVVIWAYPRGAAVNKNETSLDVVSYAAYIAASMGAHIIKVKLPDDKIMCESTRNVLQKYNINNVDNHNKLKELVAHVMRATFGGRRIVLFSGGPQKNTSDVMMAVRAIRDGGGNGSIIGRNIFQRPREEGLKLLNSIVSEYRSIATLN